MATTEKKIEKMKKSRLWPSVLLFVISLIVGSLLVAAQLALYASYVMETKHMQLLAESRTIVQEVEAYMLMGEDAETALAHAVQTVGKERQAAVLDADGKLLAAAGGTTEEQLQKIFSDGNWTEREIFWDGETVNVSEALRNELQQNGETMDSSDIFLVMLSTQGPGIELLPEGAPEEGDVAKPVLQCSFWQSLPIAGGCWVIVKNDLVIRVDDLVFGIAITAVSGIMYLLVLTILFVNVISKVTSHRRLEKLLLMDEVTGGDNRLGFMRKAARALKKKSSGKTCAVVNFSIVKYQNYCSLYGTKAGEQVLVKTDWLLSAAIEKKEALGHVGGGDFALYLMAEPGEGGKQRIVERVEALLPYLAKGGPEMQKKARKYPEADVDLSGFTFRAGICFVEPFEDGKAFGSDNRKPDINEMYANAGVAKDSLAAEEGSGVACFGQKMWAEQMWQHKVENTMQDALDNEEFQVYIQPKYNPVSGKLQGAEALVRWLSPTEGMIPPGRFIPIFEKTGFVTRLDDYMISHVAKLQGEWLAAGRQIVPISVNVSRAHFAQPDLAEHIRDLVDAYRVPHEYIEIELTESAFFDDKKALLTTVRKLQGYGFDVSMDDFGSGYSSLNSLKDLPLNVLKLDAEFFRGDDFDTRGGKSSWQRRYPLPSSLTCGLSRRAWKKRNRLIFWRGRTAT